MAGVGFVSPKPRPPGGIWGDEVRGTPTLSPSAASPVQEAYLGANDSGGQQQLDPGELDPDDLPPGWVRFTDAYGRFLYLDAVNNTLQWEHPYSLPPGWFKFVDEHGRAIYLDSVNNITQWEPPSGNPEAPQLPKGWERLVDDKGRSYFHNTETEKTQWEHPAQLMRGAEGFDEVVTMADGTRLEPGTALPGRSLCQQMFGCWDFDNPLFCYSSVAVGCTLLCLLIFLPLLYTLGIPQNESVQRSLETQCEIVSVEVTGVTDGTDIEVQLGVQYVTGTNGEDGAVQNGEITTFITEQEQLGDAFAVGRFFPCFYDPQKENTVYQFKRTPQSYITWLTVSIACIGSFFIASVVLCVLWRCQVFIK